MDFRYKIRTHKDYLKTLIVEIRNLRRARVYGHVQRSQEFRAAHIAYCLARGRQYEQIENYCRHKPCWPRVNHHYLVLTGRLYSDRRCFCEECKAILPLWQKEVC